MFDKLKAMALKMGYTHISIEFLTELRDVMPEFEQFMRDMRALVGRPEDDEDQGFNRRDRGMDYIG